MGVSVMKNLLSGGFLFVGGAVLLTADGAHYLIDAGAACRARQTMREVSPGHLIRCCRFDPSQPTD